MLPLAAAFLFASGAIAGACDWCLTLSPGEKLRTGSFTLTLRTDRATYETINDVRLTVVLTNHGTAPVIVDDRVPPWHVLSCHVMAADQGGVSQPDAQVTTTGRAVEPGQSYTFGTNLKVAAACAMNATKAGTYKFAVSYAKVDSNVVEFTLEK